VTATDPNLFQSPFRAGIKIDAYQMEPLRKALRLPRVNLFIADDTGLGKTIEAGLIARELLLRKKAKTIVVATPPSVLEQWKDELDSSTASIVARPATSISSSTARRDCSIRSTMGSNACPLRLRNSVSLPAFACPILVIV
jgi:SNF2 family DNA or RNA helicase